MKSLILLALLICLSRQGSMPIGWSIERQAFEWHKMQDPHAGMQRVLMIVKPEIVARGLTEVILAKFLALGLKEIYHKTATATKEHVWFYCKKHYGTPYYDRKEKYMLSGPVEIFLLEGVNAIYKANKLKGFKNPKFAEPGSIRADYAKDEVENAVHTTESEQETDDDLPWWFTREEIASFDSDK